MTTEGTLVGHKVQDNDCGYVLREGKEYLRDFLAKYLGRRILFSIKVIFKNVIMRKCYGLVNIQVITIYI